MDKLTENRDFDFFKKFNSFLQDINNPLDSADNPHFKSKYVPLDALTAHIKEYANKYGLAFFQTGEGRYLKTSVISDEGIYELSHIEMPLVDNPQKNLSIITYYRRAMLEAICGITGQPDDDGNFAAGNATEVTQVAAGSKKQSASADDLFAI